MHVQDEIYPFYMCILVTLIFIQHFTTFISTKGEIKIQVKRSYKILKFFKNLLFC